MDQKEGSPGSSKDIAEMMDFPRVAGYPAWLSSNQDISHLSKFSPRGFLGNT